MGWLYLLVWGGLLFFKFRKRQATSMVVKMIGVYNVQAGAEGTGLLKPGEKGAVR